VNAGLGRWEDPVVGRRFAGVRDRGLVDLAVVGRIEEAGVLGRIAVAEGPAGVVVGFVGRVVVVGLVVVRAGDSHPAGSGVRAARARSGACLALFEEFACGEEARGGGRASWMRPNRRLPTHGAA